MTPLVFPLSNGHLGSHTAAASATKNCQEVHPEKLLVPAAEAARMLSMGRSTFWNKVKLNELPPPIKIAGITRWRVSDLRSFVAGVSIKGEV